MRFFCFFLVFFFLTGSIRSAKIERGFNALSVYNYFEAKKLFYRSLKNNPTAAAYGLAVIFHRTDNPFYNVDSAYKYILTARFTYQQLNEEKKIKIRRWSVSDSSIQVLFEKISFLTFEKTMKLIQENPVNSLPFLNHYLTDCFFSSWKNKALEFRDDYLLNDVKKKNSSGAFADFLLDFPETRHKQEINYLFDKTQYDEETALGTAASYLTFLDNFPANRFVKKAQDELFYCYRRQQQSDLLYQFIKKFPENEHVSEAWKLFFTLSVERYSQEALAEFVLDYPEFPFKYTIIEEINLAQKKLIKIELNGKFGFIDTVGNLCIPAEYEEISSFEEGLAVTYQNGKYGYLNKKGQWIIPAKYDEAENFHDGVAVVVFNQKPIMIDRNGEIISQDFDEISDFSNGLAIVKKGNKFGAVNRIGKVIIPIQYDKLTDFKNGHAVFYLNGLAGIIDKNNYPKIKAQFEWIEGFRSHVRAKKNGLFGLISENEDVIFPFEYDRIERINSTIYLLVRNGKYGFGHSSGCLLSQVDNDYDNQLQVGDIYSTGGGNLEWHFMKVIRNDEAGIINQNGKWIMEPGEYEDVSPPHSGLMRVLEDDYFTFIDLANRKTFKQKFDYAENFSGNFAKAQKKGNPVLIDIHGNIVFSEACESIERITDENWSELFLISKSSGKGLLDAQLRWIVLPEFQEISFENPEYPVLIRDNKKIIFSRRENKIIWKE